MTPGAILVRLVARDPGRPRITCYDDSPDGNGERVELSGRVLANWVAKAANALQDEFDTTPGDVVRLDLPPHWRTLYWALAVWSAGAAVAVRHDGVAATVRIGQTATEGIPTIVVTRAALARRAVVTVDDGNIDDAAQLAGFPDAFTAREDPDDDDLALIGAAGRHTYAALTWPAFAQGSRVHTTTTDTEAFLRTCLGAFAVDGSVVLSIAPDQARLHRRLLTEAVQLDLG